MDTLTHALSGALLARALTPSARRATGRPLSDRARHVFGPEVPVWQALLVGLIAGAFPDSDVVLKYVSDIAYLRGHRGVTHSLVMLPLWALLLGAWPRWRSAGARRFDVTRGWRRRVAIHIAGDWITSRHDAAGAAVGRALRPRVGVHHRPHFQRHHRRRPGRLGTAVALACAGRAGPGAAAAYVSITVIGKTEAIAFAQDWAQRQGITAVTVDAAPRPASPFNWSVFVFDGAQYHVAHVNTRRSAPLVAGPDDFFVRRFSAPYQPLAAATWERWAKFGAADDAPWRARCGSTRGSTSSAGSRCTRWCIGSSAARPRPACGTATCALHFPAATVCVPLWHVSQRRGQRVVAVRARRHRRPRGAALRRNAGAVPPKA